MLVLPSPKVHAQLVTLPVVVLVNATLSGATPLVGVMLKLATGAAALRPLATGAAALTLIGATAVLVELPPGPVAVSFTV